MTEIGTRVWVVRDATDEQVNAYGFGTYVGDRLMDGWDHPDILVRCSKSIQRSDERPLIDPHVFYGGQVDAGKLTRDEADAAIARTEASIAAEKALPHSERVLKLAKACGMNPVIELDSGGWVWGAECWWGEADDDAPAKWAKGRQIVTVALPSGWRRDDRLHGDVHRRVRLPTGLPCRAGPGRLPFPVHVQPDAPRCGGRPPCGPCGQVRPGRDHRDEHAEGGGAMTDVDNLPPTQYLIMEVLAARLRTGEPYWTFPAKIRVQISALTKLGLAGWKWGTTRETVRAWLTDKGLSAAVDMTYQVPTLTLAQALDTLPSSNDEFLTWMRAHGLGHGAGIGAVINAVKADLRKLAGGEDCG
jgi:hypothetical protein